MPTVISHLVLTYFRNFIFTTTSTTDSLSLPWVILTIMKSLCY